jgi:hypothetical protein
MHIMSRFVPAEEAAQFEQDLLEQGFLHVVKNAPEELHPKEFLKYGAEAAENYVAGGFTFIWVEQEGAARTLH